MGVHDVNECGYCRSSICEGQRWVREKIFDPAYKNGDERKYRRYQAEVFAGEQLSC